MLSIKLALSYKNHTPEEKAAVQDALERIISAYSKNERSFNDTLTRPKLGEIYQQVQHFPDVSSVLVVKP